MWTPLHKRQQKGVDKSDRSQHQNPKPDKVRRFNDSTRIAGQIYRYFHINYTRFFVACFVIIERIAGAITRGPARSARKFRRDRSQFSSDKLRARTRNVCSPISRSRRTFRTSLTGGGVVRRKTRALAKRGGRRVHMGTHSCTFACASCLVCAHNRTCECSINNSKLPSVCALACEFVCVHIHRVVFRGKQIYSHECSTSLYFSHHK